MSRRVVFILSGVSGSGKSTYIRNTFQDPFVVSADHFLYDSDGKYIFDPMKLGAAHAACFRRFIKVCSDHEPPLVVVDNTNTTTEEIAPYVLGAEAFDYDVEIVTLVPPSHVSLDECARRNTHGVPLATVRKQQDRIMSRRFPFWWKHTWCGGAG